MEKNKIYFVKDYGRFKFIEGNRDIKSAKVNVLKDDFEKNGQRSPVLVKEQKGKLFITEGQHRFEACKKLGIPVMCMLDPKQDSTPEDIRTMNNCSNRWITKDYIKSSADSGNINYKNFMTLQKKYKGISDTSILAIIQGRIGKGNLKVLKDNSLKLSIHQMNELFPVLDFIHSNMDCIRKIEGRVYVAMACIGWILVHTDADKARLQKVVRNPAVLEPAADSAEIRFLETLSDAYNKGLPKDKRMHFDSLYKLQH